MQYQFACWSDWRFTHNMPNCYLPPLDWLSKYGPISWLNLPNCAFQPPVLVRPLLAWVNTFLFWGILSQAVEGSQVRQDALCTAQPCCAWGHRPASPGRGKGRKTQDSVIQTDPHAWTLALSWAVQRAGGCSYISSKPQCLLSPCCHHIRVQVLLLTWVQSQGNSWAFIYCF